MQHVREILRQKLALGRSHREVAKSLGISPSTVASVFTDARSLGLDAAAVEVLSDAELEARLYAKAPPTCIRPEPDCAALHLELRRPGVTLALLHVEFLAKHPDGIRYTALCDRYRAWSKRRSPVMRQVHVAGDKLFVDYAGMKARIVDPDDGRGHRGRALRRRPRSEQLHVRRGGARARSCPINSRAPSSRLVAERAKTP